MQLQCVLDSGQGRALVGFVERRVESGCDGGQIVGEFDGRAEVVRLFGSGDQQSWFDGLQRVVGQSVDVVVQISVAGERIAANQAFDAAIKRN